MRRAALKPAPRSVFFLVLLMGGFAAGQGPCPPCCFTPAPDTGPLESACIPWPAECAPGEDPPCCFGREGGPCFAAQAIWWDKAVQAGLGAKTGIHLRWLFRSFAPPGGLFPFFPNPHGIGFPEGGYEIQRREHTGGTTGGGPWVTIQSGIYPATTLAEAKARVDLAALDPEDRGEYSDARLQELVDLVKMVFCERSVERNGYRSYWWIEGSSKLWSDPLPDIAIEFEERNREYYDYLDAFAAGHDGRHPLSYRLVPFQLLLVAAVDPVVARVLGLYYVDTAALAAKRYDYRINAHHARGPVDDSRPFCWVVSNVGFPAEALRSCVEPVTAQSCPTVCRPDSFQRSVNATSEMAVELGWCDKARRVLEGSGRGPQDPLVEADGILPHAYLLSRKTTTELNFKRLFRNRAGASPVRVPPILIGTQPHPDDRARPPVFKEPPYYRDDTVEPGKSYLYQVRGIDVFGRYYPPSVSLPVPIVDQVPPPAPIVTEARIIQSPGSDVVLRVSWLWPHSFRDVQDDLEKFEITLHHTAGGEDVLATVLAREWTTDCLDFPDDGLDPVTCAYLFEREIPLTFSEPVSENDPLNERVRFFEVSVRALDGNSNRSPLLRKWQVAVRDLEAPPAPATPSATPPEPPDPDGRSAVKVLWEADRLHPFVSYLLYRIDQRKLCGEGCWELSDEQLKDLAAAHTDRFIPANSVPVDPPTIEGSLVDRVPAQEETRLLYLLRARDPAGNLSGASPVSAPLHIPDGFPPAKPSISSAFAILEDGRGKVRVKWLKGSDTDLAAYNLYWTDNLSYSSSKRRMVNLLSTAELRPSYSFIHEPPRPDHTQYYRLEAVDLSGNLSVLSETAAARTLDRTAPSSPAWRITPYWACEAVGGREVATGVVASWRTPGSAVESRLLRRRSLGLREYGAWQDTTGWLGAGVHEHPAERTPEGEPLPNAEEEYQYQIEARDAAGNLARSRTAVLSPAACGAARLRPFVRGDANLDRKSDLADAVSILDGLFGKGGGGGAGGLSPFPCEAAADANGSGRVDISDAIFVLRFLLLGGGPPPSPFPACGKPAGGSLSCDSSSCN